MKNISHEPNPRGHEVVRATIPAVETWFLHKSLDLWTSLTSKLREGENLREMMKMKQVREMGLPHPI
jgi:hypothetical protein